LAAGRLQATIDRTFAFDAVAQAHAYLEQGSHTGKVALVL
jgi:NADPH:quinone reductase-like Zn-dependent oxidoreductase